MNYKVIIFTLGQIFKMVAALLAVPFITSLVCGELSDPVLLLAYLGTALFLFALGYIFTAEPPEDNTYYVKEGLVIVGVSWVLISVIGALPLYIGNLGRELYGGLSFIDWLFESASGFSTTGATMLSASQIEGMSRGLLMWRSLSHWIGGMGILMFVLALLPPVSGASGLHLFQAEATGPAVGKLVSKTAINAKILYLIYAALTVLQVIILCFSGLAEGGADPFNALIISFGTAGTGGFAATAGSIGDFNLFVRTVTGIFMLLFGINFSMYFLLLPRRAKEILKSGELRFYIVLLALGMVVIALSVWLSGSFSGDFAAALGYSAFTSVSLMTTTGFDITAAAGADFTAWPAYALAVLAIFMFCGGCAGSTAGGFKCSRVLILIKSAYIKCKSVISPNAVFAVKADGKKLDDKTVSGVQNFLVIYIGILLLGTLFVSLDPFAAGNGGFFTAASAVFSCMTNAGPGLAPVIGPAGSYVGFSAAIKLLLSLVMLAGRLEIYPLLILLMPRTYSRRK